MIQLNNIVRKCAGGYRLSKSQEKINHLRFMKYIKLFAKNEKELEILINAGHRDGIWHRKMRHVNNQKRKTTHDRRDGTT